MNKLLTILTYVCLAHGAAAIEPKDILGTWRLLSAVSTVVATGETTNSFGTDPKGVLSYAADGRMSATIVYGTRPKPGDLTKVTDQERLQLYRTMLVYAGTFSIEGDVVTHHVDISSNETWTGTKQVRYAKFDGDILVITTPAQPRSTDGLVSVGKLRWVRVRPDFQVGERKKPNQAPEPTAPSGRGSS